MSASRSSSHAVLQLISFVLFHALVTLPVSGLVAERFVIAWVEHNAGEGTPRWVSYVVTFAVLLVAFSLRAHVVTQSALPEKLAA